MIGYSHDVSGDDTFQFTVTLARYTAALKSAVLAVFLSRVQTCCTLNAARLHTPARSRSNPSLLCLGFTLPVTVY